MESLPLELVYKIWKYNDLNPSLHQVSKLFTGTAAMCTTIIKVRGRLSQSFMTKYFPRVNQVDICDWVPNATNFSMVKRVVLRGIGTFHWRQLALHFPNLEALESDHFPHGNMKPMKRLKSLCVHGSHVVQKKTLAKTLRTIECERTIVTFAQLSLLDHLEHVNVRTISGNPPQEIGYAIGFGEDTAAHVLSISNILHKWIPRHEIRIKVSCSGELLEIMQMRLADIVRVECNHRHTKQSIRNVLNDCHHNLPSNTTVIFDNVIYIY
jgi:hypothetical protein